ncbi:molybdenum cofactor biosynthesis enzyme [Curtanaerobium respiraculi]|uniref:molybdenum cofactor biosynthesis enzyme n=1 Tax=Curtanaerobium respiraculi TaxID=2949669 RepID=UPI0024B34362|nr:molybdenum cofactor biosynthesis enzyme [Curtanaerobium respiraculi]
MVGLGRRVRAFHEDDGGFTTVGMVLALLISLSLLFSAAQVHKIQSHSADVQNVADASVLAADNQVASFYVVAQTCDAVCLTLSLAGVTTAGVGAVALCVPGGAAVGEALLDAAYRIMQARTAFASRAIEGLNGLQKLLPFFAAAEACGVASANGGEEGYFAIAVLLPTEGELLAMDPETGGEEAVRELQEQQKEIEEAAEQAEEAAKRADEHRQRAFEADCGAAPSYCMEERAESLAGLSGADNPHYGSPSTWSFSVALARAQAYYPVRLACECPLDGTAKERANSSLRARMYAFAAEQVDRGYVREGADGTFEASFPLVPCNLEELKQTELYDEAVYPISANPDGTSTMHAFEGCPGCAGGSFEGYGSIRMLVDDPSGFSPCPHCEFSAVSLARVAAASTSTDNGFEHYYRIVAEEAAQYERERQNQIPAQKAVQIPVGKALESLADVAKRAAKARIQVNPPGRYGAVALVAATSSLPVSSFFPNTFVQASGALGPRAAISAAELGQDDPDEAGSVISSLLDGVIADADGGASQAPALVLGIWSAMLSAHARGATSLEEGVEGALNALPLISHSGLGTWARGRLEAAIAGIGLQPMDLVSYKPILANTYRVAAQDGGAFAQALMDVKSVAAHIPASSVNPLGAAIDVLASYSVESIDGSPDKIEVASIDLWGDGDSPIPIEVPLPPAVKEGSLDMVGRARDAIKEMTGSGDGGSVWE